MRMNMKHKFFALAAMIFMAVFGTNAQENMNKTEIEIPHISDFPVGEPNTGYAKYFSGRSWLAPMTFDKKLNVPVSNVTFEPGCRNNWHKHSVGQILIAVGGVGYYQERGKEAVKMLPGDVIEIPADVEHWHGAAPDSWFQHLAISPDPQNNKSTWLEQVSDEEYNKLRINGSMASLKQTDPDIYEIFTNFTGNEVPSSTTIDARTRYMAILATLLGCQGVDEYKAVLPDALNAGLSPVEIKEIEYQAIAYCGMGRIRPFLDATNLVFKAQGIKLPLESQATTNADDRLQKGNQIQVDIFGEGMKNFWENAPDERKKINRWLADNCFGDYYTRKGLDLRQRELITFCFLAGQGGCEPQLTGHAAGNMRMGNDAGFLTEIICQCVPYIGYPRSLNALSCIKNAAEAQRK